MQVSDGCKPERPFHYFGEISAIPRGSGNEKAVSDYVVRFARAHGLWVYQDTAYNVLIRKVAFAGYGQSEPILLQAHLDMVCEKNNDSAHDFSKDPISLKIDGDRLQANGTTLGADNGIGVAYLLALLEAQDIPHPPVEALFTTAEENGMNGARLLDPSLLTARRMINLDMETEGVFTTSSAGGVCAELRLPRRQEQMTADLALWEIRVDGLRGGHSGLEIDKERANAIVVLGWVLHRLLEEFPFNIASVSGGNKENAIPKSAAAGIAIKRDQSDILVQRIAALQDELRREYRASDPDLVLCCARIDKNPGSVCRAKDTEQLIAMLLLMPNGVRSMSLEFPGLPESSANLGVLQEEAGSFLLKCSVRSSVHTKKRFLVAVISRLASVLKGEVSFNGDYPGWEFAQESSLRTLLCEVFKELYGKPPEIAAVHGGLECGLLTEKVQGMDAVAIGPDIYNAHTPQESVSITSVKRTWEFILACLKRMR
jgi:dipeptidase D